MSDLTRFSAAEQLISTGDIDKAWSALHWIFCSTDLEPFGFYQTSSRLGINAEQYKRELLDRSTIARAFYFGADESGSGAVENKGDA